MPPTTQAVVVILLTIVLGYLAIHAWTRAKTCQGFRGDLDTVLRSLAASLIVQVPMFPLAIWAGLYPDIQHVNRHAFVLFLWLLSAVVLVPVLAEPHEW